MSDLRVGVVLDGYCGGWFGDSYGPKELIGVLASDGDTVHVFRTTDSEGYAYLALGQDDASQAYAAATADERVWANEGD